MHPIPDLERLDVAFGNIKFLPKRSALPEEYQREWHRESHPYCHAVSSWFYKGCEVKDGNLIAGGHTFRPKDGVDGKKALSAISAVLRSFDPQHEHKIGGAGWLLSEWFDLVKDEVAAA